MLISPGTEPPAGGLGVAGPYLQRTGVNVWSFALSGISPGSNVLAACVSSAQVSNNAIGVTNIIPQTGASLFRVFTTLTSPASTSTFSATITGAASETFCIVQAFSGVVYATSTLNATGLTQPPVNWNGAAVVIGAAVGTSLGIPTISGASSVVANISTSGGVAMGFAFFPTYVANSAIGSFSINGSVTAQYSSLIAFSTV